MQDDRTVWKRPSLVRRDATLALRELVIADAHNRRPDPESPKDSQVPYAASSTPGHDQDDVLAEDGTSPAEEDDEEVSRIENVAGDSLTNKFRIAGADSRHATRAPIQSTAQSC